MFVFPHGIHIDRDGIWVTDGNFPTRGRGAAPIRAAAHDGQADGPSDLQVQSRRQIAVTLGKAGGNRQAKRLTASFYQPNDVIERRARSSCEVTATAWRSIGSRNSIAPANS